MALRDHYQTLGVPRDATPEAIKQAWRKLAREHHPDRCQAPGAADRMKAVNEAYAVLSDAQARAAFDGELARRERRRTGGRPDDTTDDTFGRPGFDFAGAFGAGTHPDLSSVFEAFFGQATGGAPSSMRPGDQEAALTLSVEDAWSGATRRVALRVPQVDARGRVRHVERMLDVRIPAGVRPGDRIRLAGQGVAAPGGGPPGDLHLVVEIAPHPRYELAGRDLRATIDVAPWEAALGAVVPFVLPDGRRMQVRVPQGAAHGRVLTLPGKGLPGDPPGDLDLRVNVVQPRADTPALRAAYEQLANAARASGFDPRAPQEGRA